MKKNNILVTGCCGFIGYHVVAQLLKSKKNSVTGIDNLNNYYSIKIKQERLKNLKKYKNFLFIKGSIEKEKTLKNIKKKFNIIIHLAAQAGVRYSIINPGSYFHSNIIGFYNILEFAKKIGVKTILYASSSSVYGDVKNFPVGEKTNLNTKNIYALTKANNEQVAEIYSNFYKLNLIGLRFFTVFGEFGRPDMFMFKFLKSFYDNKKFYLYNHGKHIRDFTYINDVVKIIEKILKNRKKFKNHHIFNICSNNPIKLTTITNFIQKFFNNSPKIIKTKLQKADVIKTHGDNQKIRSTLKFSKYTDYKTSLKNTVLWFKKNQKLYE